MRNHELRMILGRARNPLSDLDDAFQALPVSPSLALPFEGEGREGMETSELPRWFSILSPLSGALAAAALVFGIRTHTPLTAETVEFAESLQNEIALPLALRPSSGQAGGGGSAILEAVVSHPLPAVAPDVDMHSPLPLDLAQGRQGEGLSSQNPPPEILSPVGSDRPVVVALPLSGGGLGEGSSASRSHSASRRSDALPLTGGGLGEGTIPGATVPSLKVFHNFISPALGERVRILISGSGPARLRVFNRAGEPVTELWSGELNGEMELYWSGRNGGGVEVPTGLYVLSAEIAEQKFQARLGVKK